MLVNLYQHTCSNNRRQPPSKLNNHCSSLEYFKFWSLLDNLATGRDSEEDSTGRKLSSCRHTVGLLMYFPWDTWRGTSGMLQGTFKGGNQPCVTSTLIWKRTGNKGRTYSGEFRVRAPTMTVEQTRKTCYKRRKQ